MNVLSILGLFLAITLVYVSYVFIRLGFPQRIWLLLRMGDSLSDVLEQACKRYGNRTLIELQEPLYWVGQDSSHWSANKILALCNRLSSVWSMLGVRRGDRLAIYKANQFDIFLFSSSAIRIGAIAAPINSNVPAAIAARYMDNLGATTLVTDTAGYLQLFSDGATPPAKIKKVIITDAKESQLPLGALAPLVLTQLLETPLSEPPLCLRGNRDPLYIVHTSGTTGVPKGVILQTKGLVQSLRSLALFNLVTRSDVGYFSLPLNHQVSQLYLHAVLLMGMRCIINLDFDARRILETIKARRPTLFFAFPITYTRMIAAGSDSFALDSMRIWGTTADASHEVQQRAFLNKGRFFKQLGIPVSGALFIDGLGSSEVGIAALLRIATPWTRRFERRVGHPTPFGPQLKIVDSNGVPVTKGEPGRLMIKGACMFAGYWNAHDTLYAATSDGWWFTGDLVRQDKNGEFIHLDREVDAMRTAQGTAFTLPIEERILKYPGVLDTCVFGIRDEDGFDLPVAVVALRDDAPLHAAQTVLIDINAQLATREKLHYLWIIPWQDFPIGATGKTLKRCLRETYGDMANLTAHGKQLAA